jgi:hypothetical protein
MLEHVARDIVATRVVGQSEHPVRVDGVMPVRLQRVRPDLVGEPDAAPLLPQIEHRA